MPTNLKDFNAQITKAAKGFIDEDVAKFVKAVALEVFRRIILRTPVDTGRARGNWQIEIGQAAQGIIDEFTDGESDFTVVFDKAEAKLDNVKPFSVVHITNNVEYVYYLEYDKRSAQHPEGMVEITLAEMALWASKI